MRKEDNFRSQGSMQNNHIHGQLSSQIRNPRKLNSKNIQNEKRGKEVWRRKGVVESSKQAENRRIEATLNQAPSLQTGKIQVRASGNGWLLRSVVATIRKLVSASDLEMIFSKAGIHVQIRPMGGRSVIIIFPDMESRDLIFKEKWISIWFEQINPWNGEQANEERFVWLSCFAMPLNAWSISNFKEIGGVWGHFIQVDEGTLQGKSFAKGNILIVTELQQMIEGIIEMVVDGASYKVRVKEEDSFRFVNQNQFSVPASLPVDNLFEGGEDKEDNDVSESENDGSKNADLGSKIDDKAVEKIKSKSKLQLKESKVKRRGRPLMRYLATQR